jgi:hypothetical protein
MAMKSRKIATARGAFDRLRAPIVLLLTLGLLYSTPPTFSCGPFIERAVFTYSKHPDFPLARFAAGGLGVLQPTYARSYLAVAYRHLTGAPLDTEEQKAATALWAERLQTYWENDSENWVKTWLAARGKVAGVAAVTEIEVYRPVDKKDSYHTYLNCSEDAFRTAASTLDKMIEKHGAASAEVKDWVQAQDQVFQNCSGGASLPSPASLDAPAPARAGRAYQIAAANFYAGNFDAAEKMFGQIAADASSPWREAAPYLLARTLVRKATLAAEETTTAKAALAQAESQLKRVLMDGKLLGMHAAAERLLGFVRFRLSPEERLHELAQAIVKKNTGAGFKQYLADYTLLLDKFMGEDEGKKFAELPKAGRSDEVTDWVLTFQVSDKDALDHSLQKWEKTSSLPWLTASLSKITAADPRAPALVEAAAKVDPRSPAFASLAFHSLRLMIEANRTDDARKRLGGLLESSGSSLPPSALNLFLSLRMKLATTLNDFLKYALRTPAGTTFDEDGRELSADASTENKPGQSPRKRSTFDTDATRVLNEKVPLSILIESATNKTLPAHLRRDVAIAAWTRAVLLDDEGAAGSLVPVLQALVPELKTNLEAYLAAEGKDAKRFSAVYIMLKFPGTRPVVDDGTGRETELGKIDDFRDNWWCAFEGPGRNASTAVETPSPKSAIPKSTILTEATSYPDFLSEAERATAAGELKLLYTIGPAPNYFAAQAVRWADIKADDPRAPEALHLAVRATRYGCRDDKTGSFSKQAFDALHKKYPKSAWAQKTRYWFKD